MGSNPTLSATFAKTLASLAGSGWQAIAREFWAKVVLRRRERSERLAKEDNSPPAVSLTNCVPRLRPAPQHGPMRRNSPWRVVCPVAKRVLPAKRFVYIIRSTNRPQRRYVGVTSDLQSRLNAHNAGKNRSTAPWTPSTLDVSIEFRTERTALRFEKYLKSGAGHAFASRHFVDY